jgi:Domain of unknown function (DUF2341)
MSDTILLESGSALLQESGSLVQLESAPLDWSGWRYSRTLTDSASTLLMNYVVKVNLTSANFDFALAKSDGSDLRIFDVTSGLILPVWLLDYDSVAQTATVYYKAINTSHAHTLYYGNPVAPAVSSFAAVFTHGTGFDADWGDLSTSVAGVGGAAIRYPGTTGPNDPRDYTFWRLQETPTLSIGDLNSAGVPNPGGVYTGIREFNLIRDAITNRVLKIGGKYYATFSRRPNVNTSTIDGWMCSSTSKTGPWSGFTQLWTTGTEHLNYPSSCIKVGSTYYLYVTFGWTNGGGNTPGLVVKLRTSTDLVTWTDQGTVLAPAVFNDQISGACTDIGNPWVMRCNDGTYMMVVEGENHANDIWACHGATSTDLLTWTPLNSGNPLIVKGAGGTWNFQGSANPKCLQMPDNTYMMMYNGADDVTNLDWEIGFAYAAARGGPYTNLAANPVAGHTTGTYGCETSHLSWDEDGTSYFNIVQRFDTTSATAHAFFVYPEKLQGGLLVSRDPTTFTDGAACGRLMDAGNFTAENRSVLLAHRSNGGTPILIGLWNSAALPTPGPSAGLDSLQCLAIERNTHDRAGCGDLYFFYWDTGGVRQSWNGSAWAAGATLLPTDHAREVIARIADDGTNYILSAFYADDGSTIAGPASIAKASVRAMPAGRLLIVGDPFTDSWCQALYLRYVQVRPYAAIEPAMVTGARVGGAIVPLPLFFSQVA